MSIRTNHRSGKSIVALVFISAMVGIMSCATARCQAREIDQKKWDSRRIEGWNVYIDRRLIEDDKKALDVALKLLKIQLKEITVVVPADAVKKLKTVPLWFSPKYPNTGSRAEYHPGVGWLKANGRDAILVKGVEFTNVKNFEAATRRMPNFTLHELAHAFHDQVLSFRHREIAAAYQRAKAGGKYDRVLRQDSEGKRRYDRAYAMTTPMEYFAESTESFFVTNDFFPFNNKELIAHDPVMHALLNQLWGVAEEKKK